MTECVRCGRPPESQIECTNETCVLVQSIRAAIAPKQRSDTPRTDARFDEIERDFRSPLGCGDMNAARLFSRELERELEDSNRLAASQTVKCCKYAALIETLERKLEGKQLADKAPLTDRVKVCWYCRPLLTRGPCPYCGSGGTKIEEKR
jgi:hypothetical protein